MSLAAFVSLVSSVLGRIYSAKDIGRWSGMDYSKLSGIVGHEKYSLMGKSGYHAKIPATLEGEFTSQGLTIRIVKSEPRMIGDRIVKSSKHRVFVLCPCGSWIPVGRIHQHATAVKHGGTGNARRFTERPVSRNEIGRFASR